MNDHEDDLRRGVAFRGRLTHGDWSIPVRFSATIAKDGEVRLRVRTLPLTKVTFELKRLWRGKGGKSAFFTLQGASDSGTSFASDFIIVHGIGERTTPTRGTIKPKLGCSRADFQRARAHEPRPILQFFLRDYEAFRDVRASCPLGEVVMTGTYPLKASGTLSGVLRVTADRPPPDTDAWVTQARALCDHLRSVMGFASSAMIRAPVEHLWRDESWTATVYSQSTHPRTYPQVFHPMSLQPIFDTAVASFFDPPRPVRNLPHALEWFCMATTYNETRLLNVMTALENLVESNLPDADRLALPAKRFSKVASNMRAAARGRLAPEGAEPTATVAAFLEGLPAKMADLNRRPLLDKILALAARWDVLMLDLPREHLEAAIKARNSVVHRGYYYDPEAPPPAERDLWDHVIFLRELFIRFVLAGLGFRGDYLSFRGGEHTMRFPPELPAAGEPPLASQAPA